MELDLQAHWFGVGAHSGDALCIFALSDELTAARATEGWADTLVDVCHSGIHAAAGPEHVVAGGDLGSGGCRSILAQLYFLNALDGQLDGMKFLTHINVQ